MSEIINIRVKPVKLFGGPTYDRESSQGSHMRLTCHERAQLNRKKNVPLSFGNNSKG